MSKIYYIGGTERQLPPDTAVADVGFLNHRKVKRRIQSQRAKIFANGSPGHIPGVLKLPENIAGMTEGELDLRLAKQRAEIDAMNSAAVAGPENFQIPRYNAAIAQIDYCIANIHNPDAISGLGDALVGKAKKAGKKTKVGKFLQKIGKGIKKGVKAVTKVVTLPLRLLGKAAMELYLPKAAPAFLYLFAEEKVLTDKMRAKRKKSEKFKNFVVKKLGMKDKHFMAIIRNNLTKRYRMGPEAYLAEKLKQVAVKGIGSTKADWLRVNPQWHGNIIGTDSSDLSMRTNTYQLAPRSTPNFSYKPNQTFTKTNVSAKAGSQIIDSAKKGDLIGAIMAAIGWLIAKLGGKKEGISLDKEDLPDVEADSGNAFRYEDMRENYGHLNDEQRYTVKDVATDLITRNLDTAAINDSIRKKLPFLNQQQQLEVGNEVQEGFEPLSETDSSQMARRIKQDAMDPTGEDLHKTERTGGGATGAMCNC